jgi:hypothetical protein
LNVKRTGGVRFLPSDQTTVTMQLVNRGLAALDLGWAPPAGA